MIYGWKKRGQELASWGANCGYETGWDVPNQCEVNQSQQFIPIKEKETSHWVSFDISPLNFQTKYNYIFNEYDGFKKWTSSVFELQKSYLHYFF